MTNSIPQHPFNKKKEPQIEFELKNDIRFLRNNFRNLASTPHRLEFYQIIFITKGNNKHTIDFKEYEYIKRSVIPVRSNQIQKFNFRNNYNGISLLFTEKFLMKNSTDRKLLSQLQLFNPYISNPILNLSENDFNEVFDLLMLLDNEYKKFIDFAKEKIIYNLLVSILLKLERIKRNTSNLHVADKNYNYFIDFNNLLESNFNINRNVSFYAHNLAISEKKLNQILRFFTGKPAKLIINERVILEIKRLMYHSHLSVKEIAFETGFSEPTNFTKFFKRHTQINPKDFIKLA